MFTRIVAAGLLMWLVVGCAQKTAKSTGASNNSPPATLQPPVLVKDKPGDKDDKGSADEKPNWLNDPRVKQDGSQLPVDAQPGKTGWSGAKPPAGGWTPPNGPAPQPEAPVAGPVGGMPQPLAVPPVTTPPTKTGGKPVTKDDMNEVWIFIENASGASGKMPRPELVYTALVKVEAKAANLVKDGSIFLTGASVRESVWAFEMKALTQGGWVASQNGVENLTAAELNRRLKAK